MQLIKIVKVLVVLGLGLHIHCVYAGSGYHYEKQTIDTHVLHIVTISPQDYKIELVRAKAKSAAIGRETVLSIAKRTNAAIAINGGFFEIGGRKDGKPSGTLVIRGHRYHVLDKVQPLLVITPNQVFIVEDNPKNYLSQSKNVSMVSGIPLLISDGKVVQELAQKKSRFYLKPHARTAIGIKPDGTMVIVVAEHKYLRDMTQISMGEIQTLMTEKGTVFAQQYNHLAPGDITLSELKEILRKEYTPPGGTQGVSILKLAEFMEKLKCRVALNLDGGGSSTLCINKKLMNHIIRDIDEGDGLETMRPVSDAIIFKRNAAFKH